MPKISYIIFICYFFAVLSANSIQAQSSNLYDGQDNETETWNRKENIIQNPDSVLPTNRRIITQSSINQRLLEGVKIPIYTFQRNKNGVIYPDTSYMPLDPSLTFRDTIFYNPAFLPVVFTGNVLPQDLDFRNKNLIGFANKTPDFHLISPDSTFKPFIKKVDEISLLRSKYYTDPNNYHRIRYSNNEFARLTPVTPVIRDEYNPFKGLITAEDPGQIILPDIKKQKVKTSRWLIKGEHSLQISQNHISDNWYKGGNSNYNIKSFQKFIINYASEKISFDNTIEWKLSLQNSSGDTLRDVSINEDAFRSYSAFGYKAFNKWSYSTTLEMKTQFFNAYPENSQKRRASFLSPLELESGIGMRYKLDKKFKNKRDKKLSLTIDIAPLSINFKYVADNKVDETRFGLKKGLDTKTVLGSTVNSNLTFNINGYTTWTSRFKYSTNYKSITSEFENKLDLALNRYFSTTLYLYLRYDEGSKKDDKLKYFQINEMLSFGLNYKW